MPDLRDRFALADRLDTPDLWLNAVARARQIEDRREPGSNSLSVGRRLVAAAVALLVFVGAGVFVWEAFSDQGTPPATYTLQPSVDPWGSLAPGLNEFPPLPSTRYGSAHVWTGTELVVWGGAQDDGAVRFDDGFTIDPAQRRWTAMPTSPLSARYFPASVWTGQEVVIWGGWERGGNYLSDGAAYDPAGHTWRALPQAPIAYGRSLAVWTGAEMVIWNPDDGTGAAYDPASNLWRRIEDSPFSLERAYAAVWTGAEVMVLGMSSDGPHEEIRARGLSYDVATNTWAELPRPDLAEEAVTIVWTGSDVIGVDYNHHVQSYRPGDEAWTDLPDIPLRDGSGWPNAVAYAAGDLFVDTVSGQIVLDVATSRWGEVLPSLRPGDGGLDPVPAGDAIFLLGPTSPAPDVMYVWKPTGTGAPSPFDGISDGLVLSEGTAHGTPWTLVATSDGQLGGLELRWDDGVSGPGVESLQGGQDLSVAWHNFGRFEPDNDVSGVSISVR